MLTLDDIHLPLAGWELAAEAEGVRTWGREDGAVLSLNLFTVPPDLPTMGDVAVVRAIYRDALGDDGGLLQVELCELGGQAGVETLFKLKIPEQERGFAFVGGYTFPFRDCSLVVRVHAVEQGVTGVRESAVMLQLTMAGEVGEPDPHSGRLEGWAEDPYLAGHESAVLANLADAERWDASFPDHPLSVVRRHRAALRALSFSAAVDREPPFEG